MRRGKLPSADGTGDPWTTFEMTLREPAPIPKAFDLTRFLASSITFMKQLSDVSVFLDDTRISHLKKQPGIPKTVGVPRGLKNTSPRGIMQVRDIQTTRQHQPYTYRKQMVDLSPYSPLYTSRTRTVGIPSRK